LKAELNLIDPLTSRLRRTFAAAPVKPGVEFRYLTALALSPDGRSLYVADSAGVVLVYEIATGRVRREISGHRALITGLAVANDGRRLLTASLDATALVWDLSPAAVVARPAPMPTPAELATRWTELSAADAAAAYRAMAVFAAAPAETTTFLAAKMSPAAAAPDSAALDRLVADLGNEKFPVREKASADLDKLGESAVRGLRDRLANVTSAEARARIVRLLDKHDPPEATPNRLQSNRALELLEGLGTPEAKALLTKLAAGAPEARLTREAKMCLSRLEAR
jgi:WD domain, G-beta repeat